MKRILTTTLMALFLCACMVFGLTACGDKCKHTYFSDCDETCDNCGETREITVAHKYYGDCDKSCHSCGKEREVTVEHR